MGGAVAALLPPLRPIQPRTNRPTSASRAARSPQDVCWAPGITQIQKIPWRGWEAIPWGTYRWGRPATGGIPESFPQRQYPAEGQNSPRKAINARKRPEGHPRPANRAYAPPCPLKA